jgi:4-hydroxy-2-oxoheptanedioate aldolase
MLDLGKRVRGIFLKLPATDVVDLAADAGFDFVVVDLEHSQLADVDAFRLVRHAYAIGFPALVRIATLDRGLVNRLLEAGAAGIHLSTVRRADDV